MRKILLATRNQGKAKEFQQIFGEIGVDIITLLDVQEDVVEIEETGTTFKENAIIKAEWGANHFHLPVLGDDSGLEIDALDGRPGVYSARYAGPETNDQKNIAKVLEELQDVPAEKRTARFVCLLALAIPGKKTITKQGVCEGYIGKGPIGNRGFGYDPIFYPIGSEQTFAQIETEEKNKISHRHQAIQLMKDRIYQLTKES